MSFPRQFFLTAFAGVAPQITPFWIPHVWMWAVKCPQRMLLPVDNWSGWRVYGEGLFWCDTAPAVALQDDSCPHTHLICNGDGAVILSYRIAENEKDIVIDDGF